MIRAVDELITLMAKVCRPVSRRLSVIERGNSLWNSLTHKFQTSEKIHVATQKMSKSGFFWSDKKEQILADYRAEIQKHEFQADYDRRSIQKLNETIESQRGEIYRAHQADERLRRDQQLLHEQLLAQNRDLLEDREKSLNEMEELKRFQCSTFDTISRRKLVEDRDTILELTGKIQELQNEINCMNDSRDFQDAQSVRSGHSHVASQPMSFPHPDPGGILSFSLGMPSRKNGPPSVWHTHGFSGNVFANPAASSAAPYPQESNPWSSNVSEHTSPPVMRWRFIGTCICLRESLAQRSFTRLFGRMVFSRSSYRNRRRGKRFNEWTRHFFGLRAGPWPLDEA